MDLSFEKVLTARQITIGQPASRREARLYREGTNYETIALSEHSVDNVDYLVASGDRVPLSDSSADIVSSCNLVDIIADPSRLVAEKKRLAVPGGLALVATPYLDHSPAVVNHLAAESGDPRMAVKELLGGFEILEERDQVPWLLRASDRHYDVYLDHCVVARRLSHSA
jgi:SAM-dependent methyltransferase